MDPAFLATSLGAYAWDALAAPLAVFSHWTSAVDSPWNWAPLTQKRWDAFMTGFRITLPLLTAGALVCEWRARKLRKIIPGRLQRRLAVILTVLGFGAYFDFGNPNTRYGDYYHRHEFYHYYLGSKFSDELGYTRLYECTMVAEVENGHGESVKTRELRDLRVNLIKPVTDTYVFSDPGQCKQHFTPERWASFKRDIAWFRQSAAGTYWEDMQKDHGYNPPPVWTMTGKFFGSFGRAGDVFFKSLACIDILLQLGAVLMIRWALGWRAMAIATVFWGCNAPANVTWTSGAFLRQDWFFLLVAAFCLARKRMFGWAGAALTWSSLLRVFPILTFSGVGIIMLFQLIKRWRAGTPVLSWRGVPESYRSFIAGSAIAAAVLVPTSIAAVGAEAYRDFYHHTLTLHNRTPLTNHMGLETILVHNWEGRMRFGRNDVLDDAFEHWKDGRLERFRRMRPVFIGIVSVLTLWTAWALRRTKLLWMGMALSVPLTMALTNLTCYYYCMFMLGVGVAIVRRSFAPAYLAASASSQILLHAYYHIDDQYVSISYLFFLLCLFMLYSYSRPFSLERLRAWWRGQPEPTPEAG